MNLSPKHLMKVFEAIKSDNVSHFNQTIKCLWNDDYLKQLLEIKCDLHQQMNMFFICCKFGCINILRNVILLLKSRKNSKRLLTDFLCLKNTPHKNSLLMMCVIPNINSVSNNSQKNKKLACLNFLLQSMINNLDKTSLSKIVNHLNYHSMHVITLASKYNDLESMKCLFNHCNSIINRKFIGYDENGINGSIKNKNKSAMYVCLLNNNLNMVDWLKHQSTRSATFSQCRSYNLPTTTEISGKTNSVTNTTLTTTVNQHSDYENNKKNRAENERVSECEHGTHDINNNHIAIETTAVVTSNIAQNKSIQLLKSNYRIFSFRLGELKKMDQHILSFLSCGNGLQMRRINKYFNKLVDDNLIGYYIFENIINSLKIIPQRAKNIQIKIQDKNKYDEDNGSHVFIDRCVKNQMFDQFLNIIEKNEFYKQSGTLMSKASENKSEIAKEFITRFDKKCEKFLLYFIQAKKYHNGQMFLKSADFGNAEQWAKHIELLDRWCKHKVPETKCSGENKVSNIVAVINLISSVIDGICKWDCKLWKDTNTHWQAFKKLQTCYGDLFDIFSYFVMCDAIDDEDAETKRNTNYSLWGSIWRHFEESIVTWLLVKFLDKLPQTQDFIGNFKNREIVDYEKEGYHTDFGNVSFLEFFIELKTTMVMEFYFYKYINFHDALYHDSYDNDLGFELMAKYGLSVTFYHFLTLQPQYHSMVGAFRTNFIVSGFLLTNSARLRNRGLLIQALFAHNTDRIYDNSENRSITSNDCTSSRFTLLFLKDMRPFGIEAPSNESNEYCDVKWHEWIELFEHEKNINMAKENETMKNGHGYDIDSKVIDFEKLKEKLLYNQSKVMSLFPNANDHGESIVFESVLSHGIKVFEESRISSNYEYETLDNEKFVSNTNGIIKLLQKKQ